MLENIKSRGLSEEELKELRHRPGTAADRRWLPWPCPNEMVNVLGAKASPDLDHASGYLVMSITTDEDAVERLGEISDLFPYPFRALQTDDPERAKKTWVKVAGRMELGQRPKPAHIKQLRSLAHLV